MLYSRYFSLALLIAGLCWIATAHGAHHHHHHHADDRHHHDDHSPDDSHDEVESCHGRPFPDALMDATLASFATSILPIAVVPIAAALGSIESRSLLCMTSFAGGAILGDFLLHVSSSVASSPDSGTWVVVGFGLFFLLDGCIGHVAGCHATHTTSSNSSNACPPVASGRTQPPKKRKSEGSARAAASLGDATAVASPCWSSAAITSLMADFFHNVTDGLAIGVSAPLSRHHAMRRALVLAAHELPHEIGDYAMLVRCGWSLRSVIVSQLVTATGNWIGCLLPLVLHYYLGTQYALVEALEPMVSGSLLYVSCVVMLGDVARSPSSGLVGKVLQVVAFGSGAALMRTIELLQHDG